MGLTVQTPPFRLGLTGWGLFASDHVSVRRLHSGDASRSQAGDTVAKRTRDKGGKKRQNDGGEQRPQKCPHFGHSNQRHIRPFHVPHGPDPSGGIYFCRTWFGRTWFGWTSSMMRMSRRPYSVYEE